MDPGGPVDPYAGLSDRERFALVMKQKEEEKKRQQQSHPLGVPVSPPKNLITTPYKDDPNTNEKRRKLSDPAQQTVQKDQSTSEVKYYACDKCKGCDEYVKGVGSNCASCGCPLLFHLKDEDEDAGDEADDFEWDDDDDDGGDDDDMDVV
jgi:hypothetical protein